jgi:spoIIIJ-associated protein
MAKSLAIGLDGQEGYRQQEIEIHPFCSRLRWDFEARMNDNRTTLEVIAPSIEEALAQGLSDLGLTEKDVEVEVLDEGSRGLFGIGSRQARIRITIKPVTPTVELDESLVAPEITEEEVKQEALPPQTSVRAKSVQEDITLHVAQETVSELLEKMHVKAEVTASFGEPEDARSRVPVRVDIHGNDLSILIGRQAETLNALQYIANLIVAKEMGQPMTLVLDVEGYRQRRELQLRQLARRMADQAINTKRRQVLEPMPSNERRLIHIELRDNPLVSTESIGEDPHRKVTIIPK